MSALDPAAWIAQGRDLADAATPGPWHADRGWVLDKPDVSPWLVFGGQMLIAGPQRDTSYGDGFFIADARTRLPVAMDALAAVLALHQPVTWTPPAADPQYEPSAGYCPHCHRRWPCLTVAAITEAIERGRA